MIEYHKIVKHYDDKDNFQVFVFKFNKEDTSLSMLDLFVVTVHNGYKSQVRIDIDNFVEHVFHHGEPMNNDEVNDLHTLIEPILSPEYKQERDLEIFEQHVEETNNIIAENILKGHEMATKHIPPYTDFEEYAKEHKNSKSK